MITVAARAEPSRPSCHRLVGKDPCPIALFYGTASAWGEMLSVVPKNRMYLFEGVLAETGNFVICSVRFRHDNPALRVTIDRQLTGLLPGRGQVFNIMQP